MTLQEQLQLREHDLPPRWDGVPVSWGEWEPRDPLREGVVFICPPPKVPEHCSACGSIERPLRNRGLVSSADVDHLRLLVNRCPDCRLDHVWDLETDTWWTLDLTDYGPEGSVEPASDVVEKCATRPRGADKARAAIAAARASEDEGLW